jgi:hypothetical protein
MRRGAACGPDEIKTKPRRPAARARAGPGGARCRVSYIDILASGVSREPAARGRAVTGAGRGGRGALPFPLGVYARPTRDSNDHGVHATRDTVAFPGGDRAGCVDARVFEI